jgi:hypothetical protein
MERVKNRVSDVYNETRTLQNECPAGQGRCEVTRNLYTGMKDRVFACAAAAAFATAGRIHVEA